MGFGLDTIQKMFSEDDVRIELINRSSYMSGEIVEDTARVTFDTHTELWECTDWAAAEPCLIARSNRITQWSKSEGVWLLTH